MTDKFIIILVSILFLLAYVLTFGRWGHIIMDGFHDYYVASVLSSGKQLYNDVAYLYPPLVPYLFGLLFSIFKPSLYLIYIAGGIIGYLFTIILYATARQVLDIKYSFFVVLLFLAYCCFQPGNQSYIFPYVMATTLAPLFSISTLLALLRHHKTNKTLYLYIASLLTVLGFLIKVEFAYAQAALMVIYPVILFILKDRNYKSCTKPIGLAFIITSFLYVCFAQLFGTKRVIDLIFPISFFKEAKYYVINSGFGFSVSSFLYGLAAFLCLAIISGIFIGAIYLFLKLLKEKRLKTLTFSLLLIILLIHLLDNSWIIAFILFSYLYVFAGCNFIVLISLAYFIKNIKKDPVYLKLTLISLLGLLTSIRAPLFVSIIPYGSYYLPVIFIILLYFLFKLIPETFFKKLDSKIYIKSSIIFVLSLIILFIAINTSIYKSKNVLISSQNIGFIYANDKYGGAFNTIIDTIKKDLNNSDKIFVMPEEVVFYTFLNTTAPGKYYFINPAVFGNNEKKDNELYTELKNNPPKYIIVSNLDRSAFGPKDQIESYYKKHIDTITTNYNLIKTVETSFSLDEGNYYRLDLYKVKQ